MPPALEAMARRLVASGKLRINADTERNFVRYGDQTFSARELTEPALRAHVQAAIARHVAPSAGPQGVADVWDYLRLELKKARGVAAEKELKVARVLVQSAHPAVIQLLLERGAEIFVSYSHNVGDLMAVHEWQGHGQASGLQATEDEGAAVYVSAGGDPFFEGEHKTYVTDGFPALARMVVIAGQELGHFADLRRGRDGAVRGRYSLDATSRQMRADPIAAAARMVDRKNIQYLSNSYNRCGLGLLRRAERGVAFYHSRLRYSPPWIFYQLFRWIAWSMFVLRCRGTLLTRFKPLPYHRLGEAIELYLADMAFNLAPDAEVYRHPDPLVEEAIAVIEAVARVPQQVHKWGETSVSLAWPGLYQFYFGTVIPGCEAAVLGPQKPVNITELHKLRMFIRRQLRARPGYYPTKNNAKKAK